MKNLRELDGKRKKAQSHRFYPRKLRLLIHLFLPAESESHDADAFV